MYMEEGSIRQVDTMPPREELREGEFAARIGCFACPKSVNLVAMAEAREFVADLRKTSVPYSVKGAIDDNAVGWDRSGPKECDDMDFCALETIPEFDLTKLTLTGKSEA